MLWDLFSVFNPTEFCANFDGELRTVWFAADKLSCSKDHIIELVNEGDLKYVDIARTGSKHREIRFTDEQLDEFAKNRTRQRSPFTAQPRAKAREINVGVSGGNTFEDRFRNKYGCAR